MVNFRDKPYFLDEESIKWVEETYNKMSIEERIGQLFFPICYSADQNYLRYEILNLHPGGVLFKTAPIDEIKFAYSYLQENSNVPLLTAANLEYGGVGLIESGTAFGTQMEIAASNNKINAYRLGKISAVEGKAVGCNTSFAPVVDIDLNFRNPITNVRTFGSDIEKIIEYSKEYVRACNEENIISTIKHFPGDGVDERDQHIVTSINSLSKDEWFDTFGKVYSSHIKNGIKAIMVGHIALPSFQNKDKYLPASLSKEIVTDLLKNKLGYNGLIVSDATPMAGFCAAMERSKAVPTCINAGVDMFLFNKDYREDYMFMMEAYKNGVLSEQRLKEANYKILATKASINLHKNKDCSRKDYKTIVGNTDFLNYSKELADQSITLVHDKQKILPISSSKSPKVLLEVLGDSLANSRIESTVIEELEKRNFEVVLYKKEKFDFEQGNPFDSVSTFKEKYDLVLYVANIENASNKTTNRINWYTLFGLGNNLPWFVKEVPTIFVSLANPYHLIDVPMIDTFINCYANYDVVIKEVIKKICGESDFKGINPIDPYCGFEYLKNR